jgi:hypothetical protein
MYPAAETQVTGLTSMLGYIDIVRVIDEAPTDLSQYGLDNPRVTIDFKLKGDTALGGLQIGKRSPTGTNVYAKRTDEKRVFLVGAHQESSLNRTTFDLRDKELVNFAREQVDGVQLSVAGQEIAFERDAGRWKMVSPVAARADFNAVDGLIGSMEVAQIRSVVSDTEPSPDQLRSYGLDKPQVSATVSVGDARTTLLLGGSAGDGIFYAKDASKPAVVTVDNILADDLRKQTDEYRHKDAFEFRAFNANRVEFTSNDQTIVFERVKGQGDTPEDSWRRTSPNPGDVDRTKFEALLTQLTEIRAASFTPTTAGTGLGSPVMTVLVKFDEGAREERVAFGRTRTDAYASRPDEPGALKIDGAQLDKALESLGQFSS